MRILRDRYGTEWQVWCVKPDLRGYLERRNGDRRRFQNPNYTGEERRTREDRRHGGSIMDGWLCFQSHTEKRRLLPVPPDWESCPEDRLARLLRVATPVQRHSA